jgi:hypothetical protein
MDAQTDEHLLAVDDGIHDALDGVKEAVEAMTPLVVGEPRESDPELSRALAGIVNAWSSLVQARSMLAGRTLAARLRDDARRRESCAARTA